MNDERRYEASEAQSLALALPHHWIWVRLCRISYKPNEQWMPSAMCGLYSKIGRFHRRSKCSEGISRWVFFATRYMVWNDDRSFPFIRVVRWCDNEQKMIANYCHLCTMHPITIEHLVTFNHELCIEIKIMVRSVQRFHSILCVFFSFILSVVCRWLSFRFFFFWRHLCSLIDLTVMRICNISKWRPRRFESVSLQWIVPQRIWNFEPPPLSLSLSVYYTWYFNCWNARWDALHWDWNWKWNWNWKWISIRDRETGTARDKHRVSGINSKRVLIITVTSREKSVITERTNTTRSVVGQQQRRRRRRKRRVRYGRNIHLVSGIKNGNEMIVLGCKPNE